MFSFLETVKTITRYQINYQSEGKSYQKIQPIKFRDVQIFYLDRPFMDMRPN